MERVNFNSILFVLLILLNTQSFGTSFWDKLEVGGVTSGAYQCQDLTQYPPSAWNRDSLCRGGLDVEPEFNYKPTTNALFNLKLGFSAGNALNLITPLVIPPWNADLFETVNNINGRNRSHILTAFYRQNLYHGPKGTLSFITGIIDAADFLVTNRYANDVYTQFMNGALSLGNNILIPSYDYGGVIIWENNYVRIVNLMMNVGKNDDGNNFNFFASQVGLKTNTILGEGNYRFLVDITNKKFLDPSRLFGERRLSLTISFDQELGKFFGAWIRFAWQARNAAVSFGSLYSGGINIKGSAWGRNNDAIGLALAVLKKGNLEFDNALVFEGYYIIQINKFTSISPDIQYQSNAYIDPRNNVNGWVYGLRATVEV
jgi:hypothetical protein